MQPQFWSAVVILGAALVLSQGIEFREKIPVSKPFAEFPLKVGAWTGTRMHMEERVIDALDLSDYVMVNYKNPAGKEVDFYVAYYESQRKGESIHTPATCLPGSGWLFSKAGSTRISIAGVTPNPMPVNRALMQKGDFKEMVYYWFSQRGRILTNAYELKLYAFWDALTRQRTDGALVRLITPIYPMEEPAHAEARLRRFMKVILPVLREFIPGRHVRQVASGEAEADGPKVRGRIER